MKNGRDRDAHFRLVFSWQDVLAKELSGAALLTHKDIVGNGDYSLWAEQAALYDEEASKTSCLFANVYVRIRRLTHMYRIDLHNTLEGTCQMTAGI